VFIEGRVKKWGGELVGVDYAQLARECEASHTYLLKRCGVTTDEMRARL
jgi:hypothetical protein